MYSQRTTKGEIIAAIRCLDSQTFLYLLTAMIFFFSMPCFCFLSAKQPNCCIKIKVKMMFIVSVSLALLFLIKLRCGASVNTINYALFSWKYVHFHTTLFCCSLFKDTSVIIRTSIESSIQYPRLVQNKYNTLQKK